MKTICFVVPVFPSVSETFITNQIIGAKLNGYDIRILTSKLGDIRNASQQELIHEYDLLKNITVIDYKIPKTKLEQLLYGFIYIIKYFKYWIRPVSVSFKHRVLNWPYLLNFYRKYKDVDIFHVNFAMHAIKISEMKQTTLLGAKLITTFHGHDAHFKNKTVLKTLQQYYKIVFEASDHITVNTPYLKNIVLSLGASETKMSVIPMAIDTNYFNSSDVKKIPDDDPVKLISVGRLIEIKGFKHAINAVKILLDKGYRVYYTIIGEGLLLKSLQKQIKDLNLEDHVKLLGKKSQNDIKKALNSHHIYLMSSITDSDGRCETQGVVSAEAQAMDLPIVAFNTGGISYTIIDGETGVLVPEKNINAYADAIINLINDPETYEKMSINAREFITKNFTVTSMTKRFTRLYETN